MPLSVPIVVLGSKLVWAGGAGGAGRRLSGAAGRRALAAAEAYEAARPEVVVASGGRAWDGVVEADALKEELVRLGVPAGRVVRERCSHTTLENARFTSALLLRRGIRQARIVTCDWHAPRAVTCFGRYGLTVEAYPARTPRRGWLGQTYLWGREVVASQLDRLAILRQGDR